MDEYFGNGPNFNNITDLITARSDEIYNIVPAQTHLLTTKFIFRNRDYHSTIGEQGKPQNDIDKRLQTEIPRWELVIKYCI